MKSTFTRTRATWVAYLVLALYAYFLNGLGPITPFLQDEFSLTYAASSLHFSAFAVGILVVGLAGHLVIRRFGRWKALAVGAVGLGLGALLLIFGTSPVITIGASFGMGCVGSLILAVVPSALSEEHGENRAIALSEANTLSSSVSTCVPLLVGWLAGTYFGWRLALFAAALLALLVGAWMLGMNRGSAALVQAQATGPLPGRYWFFWACLVLAVACEFCTNYWTANYMENILGLPRSSAAQCVSLFLGGMILGRLIGSRVLVSVPTRSVVLASILLAIAGFLLYWTATYPPVAMVGLALTGFGIASLYPSILSMAIGAAGELGALAGARATLASGTAILVLPLVLGRLADWIGLKAAFGMVLLMLGVLLALILFANRLVPAPQERP